MRLLPLLLAVLVSPALAQDAPSKVLTLDAALSAARANNPTLRGAVALADASDARQDRARAAFLPQIIGVATYSRTTGNFVPRPGQLPTITRSSATYDSTMYNTFSFGATASIVVFDFSVIERFRSAKESRRSFEERVRAAELSVDFAVREAFFAARAQKSLVDVAKQTLANNQRHLEQTQAFVEVGTRPEIDLLQVRTDLANTRVTLVQSENDYAIGRVNLQRAMGIEDDTEFEVADERLSPLSDEGASLAELLDLAFTTRPDVKALEQDLKASRHGEGAAKGTFAPALGASTAITRAGIDLDDLNTNWNFGVQATWPLLSGGATVADIHEARANARRNQAAIAELRQSVRLQVAQARLGVQAAAAVIEAANEALANAQGRLQLAEGRYEAGVGNAIELGDAQVALTRAEAQSVSAEYGLSLARAQLLSALGRSR
jgi:outer membrane protein